MSDKRYELVYTGKLQPGMDAETVKSNLVLFMGIKEEKAEQLVKSEPKMLKHCATAVDAQVLAEKLEQAGIVCVVRDLNRQVSGKPQSGEDSILMSLLKKQAPDTGEENSSMLSRLLNGRQRSKSA